jgi:hypothetical protein
MKVFISWSGELSHRIAVILKEWLPTIIQVVEPYVSSEDIDKGARWFSDVSEKLSACNFGLLCLTRENMGAPWVLFEAGALSKSLAQSKVSPFLIDISPADLSGPLAQFQATTPTAVDVLKLLRSINRELDERKLDDALIEKSFAKWWPDLEEQLREAKEQHVKVAKQKPVVRSDREMLEEILALVRSITRSASMSSAAYEEVLKSALAPASFLSEKLKPGHEWRRELWKYLLLSLSRSVPSPVSVLNYDVLMELLTRPEVEGPKKPESESKPSLSETKGGVARPDRVSHETDEDTKT